MIERKKQMMMMTAMMMIRVMMSATRRTRFCSPSSKDATFQHEAKKGFSPSFGQLPARGTIECRSIVSNVSLSGPERQSAEHVSVGCSRTLKHKKTLTQPARSLRKRERGKGFGGEERGTDLRDGKGGQILGGKAIRI